MFLLNIIDIHFLLRPAFGIISCERCGFFICGIRKLFIVTFDNYMGAGHILRVKPPVIAGGCLESQFLILDVIASHKYVKSVRGDIMPWLALGTFGSVPAAGWM